MQFQVQVWVKVLKLLRDHSPIFEPIEQCFYSSQLILELQINKNYQIKYFNLLPNLSYKKQCLGIAIAIVNERSTPTGVQFPNGPWVSGIGLKKPSKSALGTVI